jgi:hypothetical protein
MEYCVWIKPIESAKVGEMAYRPIGPQFGLVFAPEQISGCER